MATVVIADDSATLRRIVTAVLTGAGHQVVAAEDGVAAVQAVFRTRPDAVVLDVQMPGLTGYLAARLLKEDWSTRDVPIVMLTSQDAASDRYWAAQAGVERFLGKDFQPPDLLSAVAEVLDATAHEQRVLRPEPVQLSAADVLSRVCDLLDRQLFETSLAGQVTALAATGGDFEHTVAGLLQLLGRVVDYHLAAVLLIDERACYLAVAHETSRQHYTDFLSAAADAVRGHAGVQLAPADWSVRVADAAGQLGADDEEVMGTFLSMPLRGHGGAVTGLLALSSGSGDAFGEAALSTLRVVDGPASLVIDNARLTRVRTG